MGPITIPTVPMSSVYPPLTVPLAAVVGPPGKTLEISACTAAS